MSSADKIVYTSFADLGGRLVALEEIRDELGRLSLDMVLGVLSRLSAQYLNEGDRFFHPIFQGELLAPAIIDDFPTVLPDAAKMYVPGRVPITGGRHIFIHEHNLCALTKIALVYARRDRITPELTTRDYGRVCRLLLIVNDHISRRPGPSSGDHGTLVGRREFAVETLYRGQFDHYHGDARKAFIALTRLRTLLIEHMPQSRALSDQFRASTGIDLEFYFEAAMLLLSYAFSATKEVTPAQSPWMNTEWFSQVPHGEILSRLVSSLSGRAGEVVDTGAQEVPIDLFEFESLQQRPIIEARPREFIVPVFSLLLRQLLSLPIVTLRSDRGFLEALGQSYQDYAHGLVVRIASGNRSPLLARANEHTATGEIDSLLYGPDVAVVVEHKAKQVVSTVGSASVARNALGPHNSELPGIATTERPKDKGGVTQPIWQFNALAKLFSEHAVRSWNLRPSEVFPLVTLMEAYRIDEWVRRGYLEPLIEASAATFPPSWHGIEWLHVSDLEALAEMADRGQLDLVALLRRKVSQPWTRFDLFIAEQNGGSIPLDGKLWSRVESLLQLTVRSFSSSTLAE